MRLIFIYGPPASGKLTIARKLSKLIGYKVYHNHLAVDLVESIFDRDKHNQIFFSLIADLNLFMLEKAIKHNIDGLIMTSCYVHPDEQGFIKKLKALFNRIGEEIDFVQITCDKEQLMKRVLEDSRKKFGKLSDPQMLAGFLNAKDLFHKIKSSHSLLIDNTNISASKVASMIKEHYL